MPMEQYLFSWGDIESSSDLDRLKLVLATIPDEELVRDLEGHRGRGRDDYPVRFVWNSLLAGIVFQHPSIESLRRELGRNGELRQLCGFAPHRGEDAVPGSDNYSRFLDNLLAREELVRAMFHQLVEELREVFPDLGRTQAIDGKALPSFAAKQSKEKLEEKAEGKASGELEPDRRREDDADFGMKTYRGTRQDGSTWEQVKSWFGFELHLLIDSEYEMPLNYKVTKASASETKELLPLVEETEELHPGLMSETCEELSADKGYDSAANNADLWDEFEVKPIIDCREFTKDGDTSWPVDPSRADTVIFDNKGNVSCVCPVTDEIRPMSCWGFEKDRGTLKYRCPAAANDFPCQGRDQCPGGDGPYGKVVRIPIEKDRRLFTPMPRDSARWDAAYARRTAVERVNSRLDNVLGFEHHTIRGLKKMETRVGLALVVMLSMALGRIRIGQKEAMRSLVMPVVPASQAGDWLPQAIPV